MGILVVASALVVAPSVASADGTRPDFAFGDPAGEVGVASFAATANLTLFLPQHVGTWLPSTANAIDPVADTWSYMVGGLGGAVLSLGAGYVFEASYLAVEHASQPGVQALYEVGVEAESVALTTAITSLVKRLVGRCRPRGFGPGGCTEHDAFPSGHTSAVAALAGARIVLLAQTPAGDGFGLRAASVGFAEAGTALTAILRVAAGAHSWEDVLTGAAVGHLTGMLVAFAHPSVAIVRDSPSVGASSAAVKERRFYFSTGFAF